MVIVLLPTYNEKDNIEDLVSEITKAAPDLYILCVDDGSEDGTAAILDRLAKSNPKLSVIHRTGIRGRGISVKEGLKKAIERGAGFVIEMDADFSHDPKYLPLLLSEMALCDLAIGSRFVKGAKIVGRPWYRNALSILAQVFSRHVMGLRMKDATSGYRCFKKEALCAIGLDNIESCGPSIVGELNYRIQKKGFKIKEIPIIFKQRRMGYSKLDMRTLAGCVKTLLRVRFSC